MTKLILIGPPGAGKGTQAERIAKQYSLPCISTGQILRTEITNKSDLGQESQSYIDRGALVPDHLILKIVNHRINQADCQNGYILDGFPRTLNQAHQITSSQLNIDGVLYLNVADQVIMERLAGRWIHLPSGRVYHEVFNPPKTSGKDDITGEDLSQRKDDTKDSIQNRLESFRKDTNPVIEYYKNQYGKGNFIEIDGDRALDIVFRDICTFIDSL